MKIILVHFYCPLGLIFFGTLLMKPVTPQLQPGCSHYSNCTSNQFQCKNCRCILKSWLCNHANDCGDGSDEHSDCTYPSCLAHEFTCKNQRCVHQSWVCDGTDDCIDGSDEEGCQKKLCPSWLFTCHNSGKCIPISKVCDQTNDCEDGSDEGSSCSDSSCSLLSCGHGCQRTPSGGKCYCSSGMTLDPANNRTCIDFNECSNWGYCDQKCENQAGSFQCSCEKGFEMKSNQYCAVNNSDSMMLFVGTDKRIFSMNSTGQRIKTEISSSAMDIEFNFARNKIYWIDEKNKIFESDLGNMRNKSQMQISNLVMVFRLAFDWISNNLYFLDPARRIGVYCLDTGYQRSIITDDINEPSAMAIDPFTGFLFFSDSRVDLRSDGRIIRAFMDGSHQIMLRLNKIVHIYYLSLDIVQQRIYWIDYFMDHLETTDYYGRFRQTILSGGLNIPAAISLSLFENQVYWADATKMGILRVNKYDGISSVKQIFRNTNERMLSVKVFHSSTQKLNPKIPNLCKTANCEQVCVLTHTSENNGVGYKCLCKAGYTLTPNQINCTKIEKFLLFACDYAVRGIPLTPTAPYAIDAVPPLMAPKRFRGIYVAVDYIAADEMIYFSEFVDGIIYKSHINGSGLEPFIANDVGSVEGITIDWISRNLYFADRIKGSISVTRLDYPDDRRELISNIGYPRAIVIHPYKGYLFYSNWLRHNTDKAYIARARFDGSNIIRIRQHELGWPNGLSIDYQDNRLYWVDGKFNRIQHSDFNGNDVQTLNGLRIYHPFGITVYKDNIYVTDWQLRSLLRINKDGSGMTTIRSNIKYMMDLKVYDKTLQRIVGHNPCIRRNGECSHFCFPIPSEHFHVFSIFNRHCGCPYGMKLDMSLTNCVTNPDEKPKPTCDERMFECANKRCIFPVYRCDGENDCLDNSDELDCREDRTCPPNHFKCNNSICINKLWVCDGDFDCRDKSDEFNCSLHAECGENQFKCNNSFCISQRFKCNTQNDCGDGSDEGSFCENHSCAPGYFQCNNNHCLYERAVCDGDNDCYDNSDEKDCPPVNCTNDQWTCQSQLQCIDKEHHCDGFHDCNDRSDENGCSVKTEGVCESNEFKCLQGGCIPSSWQCDAHQDCEDGSDESDTCPTKVCPENSFRCKNNRCIYHLWICDGDNDCGDNSDEDKEQTCPPPPFSCAYGQWECPDGTRTCIPENKVCDGNPDCLHGHDESPLCNTDSCLVNNGGCSNSCLQSPFGAECLCPQGEELNGTKNCFDKNECATPGHCSQKCVNTIGSFKCFCAEGYQLLSDKRTCRIIRNETSPSLLFAQSNKILRTNLDMTNIDVVMIPDNVWPKQIAIDYANEEIYVINIHGIDKMKLDGSNYRQIIKHTWVSYPSFAIDWIGQNIYWADYYSGTLEVASTNGGNKTILFSDHSRMPYQLAVDPTEGNRFVFWSTCHQDKCFLCRSGMDGTNMTEILKEKIFWTSGLTIDYPNKLLYFVDIKYNFIDFCDYNGKNRHRVLSDTIYNQFAKHLTIVEDRIYWHSFSKVYYCNKFKCNAKDIVTVELGYVRDLVSYSKVSQPKSPNPCLKSSCSHLCLLSPASPGYKCACPASMQLDNEGKHCIRYQSEFLLYTDPHRILPLELNNKTRINMLSISLFIHVLEMDYDSRDGLLYYLTQNGLMRQKFSETTSSYVWQDMFINPPVGFAIDWISRNLFWISKDNPAIEVFKLDNGTSFHRKILGNNDDPKGVFNPTSICLDPVNGLVYWIDFGGGHVPKKIAEVKMDGTNSRILLQENLNSPAFITKDPDTRMIYWSESYFGKIERYDVVQNHREVVLENLSRPKGLTIYKGILYFTEDGRLSISSISLNAMEDGPVILKKDRRGLTSLKVYYPRHLTNETNSCQGKTYGGCSQLCIPTGMNTHKCACSTGLTNVQGVCKVGSSFLIAVGPKTINGFAFDGTDHPEAMVPIVLNSYHVSNVAVSTKENSLYTSPKDLIRVKLDGSERTILNKLHYLRSTAIAIDWLAGNLYQRKSSVSDILEVSRLDGSHRLVLLEELNPGIQQICVNPIKRFLYWTNRLSNAKIERSLLDGTNRTVLVSRGIRYPTGITIDILTHKVYWVDKIIDAVQRISFNGGNREYIRNNLVHPSGVAVFGDNVYWADYQMHKIFTVPKNSKVGAPTVFKDHLEKISDLAVFDASVQPSANNPCSENNGGCQQLCFAIPNNATASCRCATNKLASDGRKCIFPDEFLLFADNHEKIESVFLDPNEKGRPIAPLKGLSQPQSLDFDYRENLIYFTQIQSKKLSYVQKGSNVVVDIPFSTNGNDSDRFSPSRIAVDWVGKNLYFTDTSHQKIICMNLNTKTKVTLVYATNIMAIALDPCRGYMYWTVNSGHSKIERATMAGNQRSEIISNGLGWPSGLAIDYEDERLYWADITKSRIERSNLDGFYREVIVSGSASPYSLAVFSNYVYWSDSRYEGILRAEKHTGDNQQHLLKEYLLLPTEIRIYSKDLQTCSDDPCQKFNGGCTHSCHPGANGKAECSCDVDSGLVLANNQKMCVLKNNNCTSAAFICTNGRCISKRWICDVDDDCGDGSDEHPNLCAEHMCDPSRFRCDNGRCIWPYFRCDFENDCQDNSDERDCVHPSCGENEFECRNFRCLDQNQVCDGYDDCKDTFKTDEQNCPENLTCASGEVKCPNNNICLSSRFLCDGDNDCGDNSDENVMFCQSVSCPTDDFYCSNSHRCIPGVWHCDGDDDCGNMEDEPESCKSENRTCYGNLFTCNNRKCIGQHWVCDGEDDCLDGSDEAEELHCGERTCPPNYFTCKSNAQPGTSTCIEQRFVCDGDKDCAGGEDEMQSCPPQSCSDDQFVCDNGLCIKSVFYCDHDNDCGDNSDEPSTCEYPTCGANQFRCDNQRCIPERWLCDTDNDCFDNSDEKASMCFTPEPTCPPGQFLCRNAECIDYSVVCNKQFDCSDRSDEEHCNVNECESTELNQCQHKCVDTITSFHCECHSGFALMKDKKACQDIDECTATPQVCSQQCLNTIGNFTCKCYDGYQKENDRKTCKRKDNITPWLIFSNRYYIRELSTDGQIYRRVAQGFQKVTVLDYDYSEQRLYYIDVGNYHIQRMFLNGTNKETLIKHNLVLGEGIAVDWIGRKLYWVDSYFSAISVSELNGTNRATLVTRQRSDQKSLSHPRAIVVDPGRGYLYWTDWGLHPCIGRIGMDGSGYTLIITEKLGWPNGLTIEYETNRLWWADAHYDYIEYANADGTNRHVVIQNNLPHVFAITIFEDWLYWTDWQTHTIEKANKYTGANRVVMRNITHRPRDIHIIHPLKQKPYSNPCGLNNGGCSHLCLIAPGNNYRCVCPDNFVLSSNNLTCVANCSDAQFRCGITDDRCIPLSWKCDGEEDCKNGLDEPDDCVPSNCPVGQFQCKNQNCTFSFRVCDLEDDCGDGSDEEGCKNRDCPPWQMKCKNHKCIPKSWQCDTEDDCGDLSDERPEICASNKTCSPNQFTCANGDCISMLWKCDLDPDCLDGSDESPDLKCGDQSCDPKSFKCATNYKCVPPSYVCDGENDCHDNSDELSENCPPCNSDQFQCDSKHCISKSWICDFVNDCADGSDEKLSMCKEKYRSCSESEFQCQNHKCIQGKWRCDFDNDCGDESDEINCGPIVCPDGKFQCKDGFCISQHAVCDGRKDCRDVSDEFNCTARYHNGRFCPANVFQCQNKMCIPLKWRCDGTDDCGDRSDEAPSICKEVDCPPDTHFRCDNFKCIPRWQQCNKVDNCGDSSDENNPKICEPNEPDRCESNQFKCTKKQCIDSTKVCDDIIDCNDSSDELGCHKTTGTVNCTVNNGGCGQVCTQLKQGGFYCSCRSGYQLSSTNRKQCEDIDECSKWGHNCPQICTNLKGSFKCRCYPGFVHQFLPVNRCRMIFYPSPILYLAMSSEIRQFKLHSKYIEAFQSDRPQGLAINSRYSILYWTDSITKTIHSAYIAPILGRPQQLPIPGLQDPTGIAVDWISGNIYWTDLGKKTISVAAYDGKYKRTLIQHGLRKPYAIATNPNIGWLFWTDVSGDNPTIERAWMSGENREILVNKRLGYPLGITIDFYMEDRVFWCDAKYNLIESIKSDGTDRVIVVKQGLQNPVSLDVFEEHLYWLSQKSGKLFQMDKFGRGINVTHQSGLTMPLAVKIYHPFKSNKNVKSECYKKSTCSHLCLLTPNGKRFKCACPDNSDFIPHSNSICDAASEISLELSHCNCQNGGTCKKGTDNNYFCLCQNGFYGSDCSSRNPENSQLNKTQTSIAVSVSVVLLLLLVVLFVGGFFWMKKRGKFFLNKPLIGAPSVPHTPLGSVSFREGDNINIGTPPLTYDITSAVQEVNVLENEYSIANPTCPTNFSNPMYGVGTTPPSIEPKSRPPPPPPPGESTKQNEKTKESSGKNTTTTTSKKSLSSSVETKSKNENFYVSLKTGRSFDPTEDTDKETAGLVKLGEL